MKKVIHLLPIVLLWALQGFAQGANGLIGQWTFDGNANDVSGHGMNGIAYNVTSTTGINGTPNTAYQFNGTSSYIDVPYDSLMNTQIHSFCALIKPTGFYSGSCQGNAIIWRGVDQNSDFSYQLEMFDNAYDNSDAVYSPDHEVFAGWTGHTTGNTPQVEWYYTPTIQLNTWYSVVLTYDGDSTRIYVNSVLMNTFYNPSTFTNTTNNMTFGWAQNGHPYWLNAAVDEIRFYNRVLSPAEVAMFGDSLGTGKILPVKFYLDDNNNCTKEVNEIYNDLPLTVAIDSNGVPIDTVAATGVLYYHARGNAGDVYSFKVVSSGGSIYVSCPASGVLNDTLISGINPTKYVGFTCTPSASFDLGVKLSTATDINAQVLCLNVSNQYCSPQAATLRVDISPKYVFGSASPAPSSVSGNSVTWNLGSLSYSNSAMNIHMTLNAPNGPLMAGDTVITKCYIDPSAGDLNTYDNIIIDTDTVKAPLDPNEMVVKPEGCIPLNIASTLTYTIQFENVGNDTAHNIYIMDTLPDNLDVRSLSLVSSTHFMTVAKWYDDTYHNIYKFEFPNINLLDSSHHDECTGTIVFKVNTVTGLQNGATIDNHAGIFFDDNAVVMTNTVEDIACFPLETTVAKVSSGVRIFPNPGSGQVTITSREPVNSVLIYDIFGRKVFSGAYDVKIVKIDLGRLAAGLYYVKVNNDVVKKFSKI